MKNKSSVNLAEEYGRKSILPQEWQTIDHPILARNFFYVASSRASILNIVRYQKFIKDYKYCCVVSYRCSYSTAPSTLLMWSPKFTAVNGSTVAGLSCGKLLLEALLYMI